jgi:small-conductance mechanosensitive channel
MRARIIFIILLVLILIFTLWPTVISLGAEWYGRWHGCEVEFTRAIPCIVNGEDQGKWIYETQQWAYLSLYTIPVGGMLLLGWLVLAVIVYTIYRVCRGSRPT